MNENRDTGEAQVRVRLDIAYDGTDFHGWAMQPGLRTVQGTLEDALAVLLRVPPGVVRLTVGGRTDAGVHARGQVAHLDVTREQFARCFGAQQRGGSPESTTAKRINGVLRRSARDVVVTAVSIVPRDFDARFSAIRRRYEYRLREAAARPDPLTARFTADVPYALDLEEMRQASNELIGLRDFTTFCKAREGATAVRTLLEFEWSRANDGAFVARIEADAFCHSMVRALVGAVTAVGHGRISAERLRELTEARERTSSFAVMPAHGLSLEEIAYPEAHQLAARAEQTRAKRPSIPEDLAQATALMVDFNASDQSETSPARPDIGCMP